jgi:hypothetical protein
MDGAVAFAVVYVQEFNYVNIASGTGASRVFAAVGS